MGKEEKKYEGTEMLIGYYMKHLQIDSAIEATNALPDEAKILHLNMILDFLLENPGSWLAKIYEIARILKEKVGEERLETIMALCVDEARLHMSEYIASLLGKKLTKCELRSIISNLLLQKSMGLAMEAAKLLDEM